MRTSPIDRGAHRHRHLGALLMTAWITIMALGHMSVDGMKRARARAGR